MIETIVLGSAFAILAIGNIVLATRREDVLREQIRHQNLQVIDSFDEAFDESYAQEVYSPYAFPSEERREEEVELYETGRSKTQQNKQLKTTINFMNKKYDLINERINELEKKIKSNEGVLTKAHFDEKMDSFNEFRRETIIITQALKDEMEGLKESILDSKLKTKKKKKEDVPREKLRSIIFRSRRN